MNVKEKIKASGKKIIAGTVAAVTLASSLPLQAFADGVSTMSYDTGSTGYTLYGKTYQPSDGDLYDGGDISNASFYYAYYDTDGTRHIAHHDATQDANMLLMATSPTASSGEYAICLEAGKDFEDGIVYTSYTRENAKWQEKQIEATNKGYSMKNSDQYIALAIYYGLKGLNSSFRDTTLKGSVADDWVIATQVLVWEFQQGILKSLNYTGSPAYNGDPNFRQDVNFGSGRTLGSMCFQQRLGGITTNRAKAYNWILNHVRAESTKPSFDGQTLTLKYNSSTGKYTGTITDTNATESIYHELVIKSGQSGVSVSRSGNTYTFTANNPISGTVTFVPQNEDNDMRIYESKDTIHQTVANGRTNPMNYSLNVKTESSGSLRIVKDFVGDTPTAEEIEKVAFKVKNSSGQYIAAVASTTRGVYTYTGTSSTGTTFRINSGSLAFLVNNLPTGTYTVTETSDLSKWKEGSAVNVTVTVNGTSEKKYTNSRENGSLRIVKDFVGGTPTADEIEKVTFKVTNADGQEILADTTGTTGVYTYKGVTSGTGTRFKINPSSLALRINELPTGGYRVAETSDLSKWKEGASIHVDVTVDNMTEEEYTNSRENGSLRIVKKFLELKPTAAEIEKVTFKLTNADGQEILADTTGTTGVYTYKGVTSGTGTRFKINPSSLALRINELPTGGYRVAETSDLLKWKEGASIHVDVTVDNMTEEEYINSPLPGAGALKKEFSESATAAEYAACRFTLKASDGKFVHATAQSSGNYTFSSFSSTAQEFSLNTTTHVVTISELPVGTYTFTETKTPDGWTASPSSVKITVTANTTSTANITNIKDTGSLHITKRFTDSDGVVVPGGTERAHLLSHVYFTVKDADGKYVQVTDDGGGYFTYKGVSDTAQNIKTNTSGTLLIRNIPTGKYTVTEYYNPNGCVEYECDKYKVPSAVTKTISRGQQAEFSFTNPKSPVLMIYKEFDNAAELSEDELKALYAKIEFRIESSTMAGGNYLNMTFDGTPDNYKFKGLTPTADDAWYHITDEGYASVALNGSFPPGTYTVYERYDGDDYTTDAPKTFTINIVGSGVTDIAIEEVTFHNTEIPKTGDLEIIKDFQDGGSATDVTDEQVQEITFRVEQNGKEVIFDGSSGEYIFNSFTDGSGTDVKLSVSEKKALLQDLPIGNYTITEINGTNGFAIEVTEKVANVVASKLTSVRFINEAMKGTLVINKHSLDGVLSGWKFRVQLESSPFEGYTYDNTFTTDANGVITINNLRIGTYKVTEVDSGKAGYITPDTQDAVINFGETETLEFENMPVGTVTLSKVDEAHEDVKLHGATFAVYAAENITTDFSGTTLFSAGKQVGTLTEDGDTGNYTLKCTWKYESKTVTNQLPYGKYYAVETKAPDNYVLDTTHHNFEITKANQGIQLTVTNDEQRGTLHIQKRTPDGKLSGWQFRVELIESPFVKPDYTAQTFTTDAKGEITVNNLPIGTYSVTEITTGKTAGYFTAENQEVTITTDKTSNVIMDNIPKGSVHIVKRDVDYNEVKLTGAEFTVYAAEDVTKPDGSVTYRKDAVVGTLTETAVGEYDLTDIPYGKYYVMETKAPANYVLDTNKYPFDIREAGKAVPVVTDYAVVDDYFLNEPMRGELHIQKHTQDGILENWQFRVRLISSPFESYTYDHVFGTDAKGGITIKNLRIGTYEVSELTSGVVGYFTPTSDTIEVRYNETTTVELENIPKGSLHITKVDIDYPTVKLEDAQFTVYAAKKIVTELGKTLYEQDAEVGTLAVVGKGEYQLDNIPYGDYYVKETKTPANYRPDNNKYPFVIREAGATVTVETRKEKNFEEQPQFGTLHIQKRTQDGKLSGWQFRVQLVSSPFDKAYTYDKTFTTDTNGEITVNNLRIGTYSVTEITTGKTADYFTAENQEVTITTDNTSNVIMDNIPKGSVHIVKRDVDYQDVKLTGAQFTVYAAEDVTKPDGSVTYRKDAVVGTLTETAVGEYDLADIPYGRYYVKETKAPANYVLDTNKYPFDIREAGKAVPVVTDYIESKTDEYFFNKPQTGILNIRKVSLDGAVSGWQFRVQLVSSPFDKAYTYDKTFTTDDRGEIRISDLRIGEYKITELTTGKTDYIFADPQGATIKYGETTSKTFENVPLGKVKIEKTDIDLPDIELAGAEFTVYAAADITTIQGEKLYTKGDEVGILSEYGNYEEEPDTHYYQLENLPYGDYYIKETKAPENFVLNEKSYPFVIRKSGDTATVETTPNKGFENTPMTGTLQIQKQSSDNVVEGWKFRVELVSSPFDGYTFDQTFTTDSNGRITIYGLRIGEYKITEVTTGEEKYLTPDAQDAVIEYGMLTHKTFKNVPLGSVYIAKVDADYPDVKLSGAEFTVYANSTIKDANDEVMYEKDDVVGTLTEIAEGEYQLDNIPYGNYYAVETKAPDNFVADTNVYPFTIREAGTVVIVGNAIVTGNDKIMSAGDMEWIEKVFNKPQTGIVTGENAKATLYPAISKEVESYDVGADISLVGMTDGYYKTADGGYIGIENILLNATESDFANEPARGTLEIYKSDISYGTPIEGVGYRIRNEQGDVVVEGYTDKDGRLDFTLRFGKYTFEEFDEQDGYFPNHSQYPFEITEDGQIIKADMTNEQFPKIGTTATVGEDKDAIAVGTITLNDVVEYHALVPGREYTLKGVLMDKSTGKAFLVDGKEITAETVFIPETADGEVTVTFVFNADGITEHTTLVVFETLYVDDTEYTVHADINDDNQTVELHKPEVKTTATANGEKETIAVGTVTIEDVVKYTDLIIGKEYTVKGTLMNKATGEAFLVDGKEITAEATFTAETEDGEITLSFTFDASAIAKNTELVVFEKLYKDNVEIAVHTDINDTDQTVELHKPEVKTTATANGEKETVAVGTVTIEDVVKYTDLIIGKEYTVKGTLMNKATGEAFKVDGKEITAEATFTAEAEDGEITLSFTFDGSAIAENTELVVFERLYKDNVEIAVHTDINDKEQTVTIIVPEVPENPPTGVGLDGTAITAAALAGAVLALTKRKKK